jgi:hypothetical protein
MLRNNPLHNATVDQGLMRWVGNYLDDGGSNINFLWIGEFQPADANLPGSPPQRGFSLVRDDSRGGRSAISLYDPSAQSGDGLKQRLQISSGDGEQLFTESRDGGWSFPQEGIPMYGRDSDLSLWPGNTGAAFSSIHEGRVSIVGNKVAYRVWDATTGGATGSFRLRVEGAGAGGADVTSPVHNLGVNANGVVDGEVDVSEARGLTVPIYWEAQVNNGVGKARSVIISLRCYS